MSQEHVDRINQRRLRLGLYTTGTETAPERPLGRAALLGDESLAYVLTNWSLIALRSTLYRLFPGRIWVANCYQVPTWPSAEDPRFDALFRVHITGGGIHRFQVVVDPRGAVRDNFWVGPSREFWARIRMNDRKVYEEHGTAWPRERSCRVEVTSRTSFSVEPAGARG